METIAHFEQVAQRVLICVLTIIPLLAVSAFGIYDLARLVKFLWNHLLHDS
jgi:hypothetical protein